MPNPLQSKEWIQEVIDLVLKWKKQTEIITTARAFNLTNIQDECRMADRNNKFYRHLRRLVLRVARAHLLHEAVPPRAMINSMKAANGDWMIPTTDLMKLIQDPDGYVFGAWGDRSEEKIKWAIFKTRYDSESKIWEVGDLIGCWMCSDPWYIAKINYPSEVSK